MNNKGLTLVELIVVTAIMGILLTMGTLGYRSLMLKADVESDTRQILSFTNTARQYSFTRKENLAVVVNGRQISVVDADGDVYDNFTLTVRTPFVTDDNVAFSGGFTVSQGMIRSALENMKAEYDCVFYEANRVKAGKYDGENCNAR